MKNKSYDVAIIGAGPNGLICGAYLAKAGLDVILIENRHETGAVWIPWNIVVSHTTPTPSTT